MINTILRLGVLSKIQIENESQQLAPPAAYGHAGFKRESLPMLPEHFQYCIRQTRAGKEAKYQERIFGLMAEMTELKMKLQTALFRLCEKRGCAKRNPPPDF